MTTKYKFYTEEDSAIRRIHINLATEIGFNESVVLMQLDHLVNVTSNDKVHDGKYWTYDSISNLQKKYFPFWGTTTIKKAIASLLKQKLIIKKNYNRAGFDKTNWYAIDYGVAAKLNSILVGYKDAKGCVQPLDRKCPTIGHNLPNDETESDQPIPKSSSENSSEITSAKTETNFKDENKADKTKTNLNLGLISSSIPSDTENLIPEKTNSNTEQEKNNFSSPEKNINDMTKEEWDALCQACEPPPKINRMEYRNKHKVNLKDFDKFKAARTKGFNGNAEVVSGYVNHETLLWDMKKCPINTETLKTKLEKEIYAHLGKGMDHAIVRHYLEMTPEQRELELAEKSH